MCSSRGPSAGRRRLGYRREITPISACWPWVMRRLSSRHSLCFGWKDENWRHLDAKGTMERRRAKPEGLPREACVVPEHEIAGEWRSWQRTCFGSTRSWVRVPPPRPHRPSCRSSEYEFAVCRVALRFGEEGGAITVWTARHTVVAQALLLARDGQEVVPAEAPRSLCSVGARCVGERGPTAAELDSELHLGHRGRRPARPLCPGQVPRRDPADDGGPPTGRRPGADEACGPRDEGHTRQGRRSSTRTRRFAKLPGRRSTTPRSSPCAISEIEPASRSSRRTSRPTSTASRPTSGDPREVRVPQSDPAAIPRPTRSAP